MADELVLDAPEVAEVEQVETETPVETEQVEETSVVEAKGDERTLPRWIRDLKTTRPDDYRAASDNFFSQKALSEKLKDFDLDGTQAWLKEVGGREAFEAERLSLSEKAEELDGLLAAAANGDESVIARAFEAAGANGSKLGMAAMQQWHQTDPDSYGAAVQGALAQTLGSMQTEGLFSDAPTSLPNLLLEARAALNFAPPEKQVAIVQGVMQRVESMMKTLSQPPAPTQRAQPSKLDEREQRISQAEQSQFTGGLSSKLQSGLNSDAEGELKSFIDRLPADADKKALAVRTVIGQVNEKLAADKDFTKKWDQFIARKDADGALKLAASRRKLIIGEIAKSVGRTIYGNPGPKAVVAKPAVKTAPLRTPSPARSQDPFDEIWARA